MRVAVIHDWFRANGGAEKVAGEIMDIFDEKDLEVFTLFNKFSKNAKNEILKDRKINVSMLQYIPFISKIYRYLLPVMPALMKHFDLRDFDLIISSSHAVAKGVKGGENTLHICYCHSPMRYVWDMYDDYVEHHAVGRLKLYSWFIGKMRKWDYETAKDVNYFIANSAHVSKRILNSYGMQATVIYPPVRVNKFELNEAEHGDYYLSMGRFVPYKKADLIIEAFQQMPDKKLFLIGEGYGTKKFRQLLKAHSNIIWLGYQDDAAMIRYIQGAKACIFAAKEDFGIMCVEVQACGTPVLALNYGGYRETVAEGISGYFFDKQDKESIINAVKKMEAYSLTDHKSIRENALRFSSERFKKELSAFITVKMAEFKQNNNHA